MGKVSDRWKEFIAKVRLIQPEGRNRLLLVGVYINVLLLILIDILSIITIFNVVVCVIGCLVLSILCVVGLLIYKMY